MRPISGYKVQLLFFAAALTGAWCGCSRNTPATLDITIDPETTPTMLTHNVSTLISDSGITRYHIQAPVWYVYNEAMEPKWTFPEGVFLEKYDDNLMQDATVECDSAIYFERKRLWELNGNVRIKNTRKERFATEQLFWDERNAKVYSDSFIHIERVDRVIEGYGFTSDDRLQNYVVNSVSGVFPVSEFQNRDEKDDTVVQTEPIHRSNAPAQAPARMGGYLPGVKQNQPAATRPGASSALNQREIEQMKALEEERKAQQAADSASLARRHALKARRDKRRAAMANQDSI